MAGRAHGAPRRPDRRVRRGVALAPGANSRATDRSRSTAISSWYAGYRPTRYSVSSRRSVRKSSGKPSSTTIVRSRIETSPLSGRRCLRRATIRCSPSRSRGSPMMRRPTRHGVRHVPGSASGQSAGDESSGDRRPGGVGAFRSSKELIALAKKQPGKLDFASTGNEGAHPRRAGSSCSRGSRMVQGDSNGRRALVARSAMAPAGTATPALRRRGRRGTAAP